MDPHVNKKVITWLPPSHHFSRYQNGPRWTWSFYKAAKVNGLLNLSLPKVLAAEGKDRLAEKGEMLKEKADANSSENLSSESEDKMKQFLVTDEEVNTYIAQETGMERVKEMFRKENGRRSHEAQLIKHGTVNTAVIVAFFTLYFSLKQARLDFRAENKANVFKDAYAANRQYYYSTTLKALSVSKQWFLKTFIFTGMMLFVSQTLPVYRNKSSPLDIGAGAAVAGSMWRFRAGPKASFSAGLLAGLGGSLLGSLYYGLLKLEKSTAEEKHFRKVKEKLETKKKLEEPLVRVN